MDQPSMAIPVEIASSEQVARECDKKQGRSSPVKWRAFAASKYPFEISVHRIEYTDLLACLTGRTNKMFVSLLVKRIRNEIENVEVLSSPPPPGHADIRIGISAAKVPSTMTELRTDLNLLEIHQQICMQLAQIATPMDLPTS
jgi:hypothetical protein